MKFFAVLAFPSPERAAAAALFWTAPTWKALTLFLALWVSACDRTKHEERPPLSELSRVPEFTMTDQEGQPFGTSQLAGRPYLATFMFTRCPSICPSVTARMKEIDSAVQAAQLRLDLVSISVDPEHDTPEALAAYATKHGARVPRWHFLTGPYEMIAKTAEEGFKIGIAGKAETGKPHLGITHGSHLVLVNQEGSIVGYFPSSDPKAIQQIVSAVRQLSS